MFVEEQARIRRERIAAQKLIEQLSTDEAVVLENVMTALAMTDRIQTAYIAAEPTEKRLFNQAFFEWIAIDDEDVSDFQVAEPFNQFQGLVAENVIEDEPEARMNAVTAFKSKTADLFQRSAV